MASTAIPDDATDALLRLPPAAPGMRIGLLGGSFNPAHAGHLHISRRALARLALDQLWWLVTPGNPLKPRSDLAPLSTRLAQAARLARHPRIRVIGFEARRPDAFTVNSLHFLKQRYRATHFVWVMGADALAGFHRWRRWRTIFRLCPIAVMDRPGYRFAAIASQAAHYAARYRVDESDAPGLALLQPPAWCFLTLPLCPLSSTQIRAQQH
ncbi:MAG: nicotinate-nucleotide adenylyltransferase [Methyloligellaceae bacterium]